MLGIKGMKLQETGENAYWGVSWFGLLSRNFGDQIKAIEKKHLFGIWFENLSEGVTFKDFSIDGRIILK